MLKIWFIKNIDKLLSTYKYFANIKKTYCFRRKYEVTEEQFYIFILFCIKMFSLIKNAHYIHYINQLNLKDIYYTFNRFISSIWSRNTLDGIYNYKLLNDPSLYIDGFINDETDISKIFIINPWDNFIIFNSNNNILAACQHRYKKLFHDWTTLKGSGIIKNVKGVKPYIKKPPIFNKKKLNTLEKFADFCEKISNAEKKPYAHVLIKKY